MKIAIVDDNRQEIELLKKYIQGWSQQNGMQTTVTLFDSGEAFTEEYDKNRFDIVFMDIMMDGQNGIETARSLRRSSIDTLLVFITSSKEFMAQAFPCHTFDYIIKPYTKERIMQVLDEARTALGKRGGVIDISGNKFLLDEIFYIYSNLNYCDIYTKSALRKVRISFNELSQTLLSYPSFFIAGRGVIVNFENISHISEQECVTVSGDRVPVSRRRIRETKQAFYDWQFRKMLSEV